MPPTGLPMGPPPLSTIRTHQLEAELDSRRVLERRLEQRESLSHPRSSRSTTRGFATSPPNRGSSPVDGDIADFIEWTKPRLHPRENMNLEDAKRKLLDKSYTTRHVQEWQGEAYEHKWEKLEIKPGIGRELARHVGQFGREKRQNQAITTTSSRRLPKASAGGSLASPTYIPDSPARNRVINSIESDDYLHDGQGGDYGGSYSGDYGGGEDLDDLYTFDSQATTG